MKKIIILLACLSFSSQVFSDDYRLYFSNGWIIKLEYNNKQSPLYLDEAQDTFNDLFNSSPLFIPEDEQLMLTEEDFEDSNAYKLNRFYINTKGDLPGSFRSQLGVYVSEYGDDNYSDEHGLLALGIIDMPRYKYKGVVLIDGFLNKPLDTSDDLNKFLNDALGRKDLFEYLYASEVRNKPYRNKEGNTTLISYTINNVNQPKETPLVCHE
jgi:hypothetical protein